MSTLRTAIAQALACTDETPGSLRPRAHAVIAILERANGRTLGVRTIANHLGDQAGEITDLLFAMWEGGLVAPERTGAHKATWRLMLRTAQRK